MRPVSPQKLGWLEPVYSVVMDLFRYLFYQWPDHPLDNLLITQVFITALRLLFMQISIFVMATYGSHWDVAQSVTNPFFWPNTNTEYNLVVRNHQIPNIEYYLVLRISEYRIWIVLFGQTNRIQNTKYWIVYKM